MTQLIVITNMCLNPHWNMVMGEVLGNVSVKHIPLEDIQCYTEDIESAEMVVICLNIEVLYPDLPIALEANRDSIKRVREDCSRWCSQLYVYLRTLTAAKIVWFGFEDYYYPLNEVLGTILFYDGVVDKINCDLYEMLHDECFVDFKRIISMVGIEKAFDKKGKYRWLSPYSKDVIELMVKEVKKQRQINFGITPKCLIVDCDNVLWGGVLSEDGIEGIKVANSGIGKPFQDFQRYLLNMYYHGVILVICSKNDEDDVLKVFREHSGMLLKERHIACFQCNWDNKPYNIQEVALRLNIALESVVFIDDSVFEIESVKTMLPQVKTILYKWENIYRELSCFNLNPKVNLQTVRERMDTYKTNTLRERLRESTTTYEEYLAELNTKLDIHMSCAQELARIAELTQRTNKCTNGVRYSVDDLKKKIESKKSALYTICLSDRFSNLGIVGALEITDGAISLFSLSCRALGRGVEESMIQFAVKQGALTATFWTTKQNGFLQELFIQSGLI